MQYDFEYGTCRKSSVHSLICVNDLLCKHNPKCLVQIHVISHYIANKHELMHLILVLIRNDAHFMSDMMMYRIKSAIDYK